MISHAPHRANTPSRSGTSQLFRTRARMAITTPIRMEMLPHRGFVFFIEIATFQKIVWETKKEEPYLYPESF
jgi:hypothetical protein